MLQIYNSFVLYIKSQPVNKVGFYAALSNYYPSQMGSKIYKKLRLTITHKIVISGILQR